MLGDGEEGTLLCNTLAKRVREASEEMTLELTPEWPEYGWQQCEDLKKRVLRSKYKNFKMGTI